MPKKKFYVVAVGRKPGIYQTWDECQIQVSGFSKAVFKSFSSKQEAEKFLEANKVRSTDGNQKRTSENESATIPNSKRVKPTLPNEKANPDDSYNLNGVDLKTMESSKYKMLIHFDGGSRKFGASGAGALVEVHTPTKVQTISVRKHLASTSSNNVAEYSGLIAGLEIVEKEWKKLKIEKESPTFALIIKGDSMIVINQLTGAYECKSPNLMSSYQKARILLNKMKNDKVFIRLDHVYRKYNTKADALANEAMDKKRSWITVSERSAGDHDNVFLEDTKDKESQKHNPDANVEKNSSNTKSLSSTNNNNEDSNFVTADV